MPAWDMSPWTSTVAPLTGSPPSLSSTLAGAGPTVSPDTSMLTASPLVDVDAEEPDPLAVSGGRQPARSRVEARTPASASLLAAARRGSLRGRWDQVQRCLVMPARC